MEAIPVVVRRRLKSSREQLGAEITGLEAVETEWKYGEGEGHEKLNMRGSDPSC
jgi:hypothetical protein